MSARISKHNPLTWLASLRLTVVLLAMGMYLIFVGTLAQVENGIWWVVEHYFREGNWGVVRVEFDVFRALLYPGSENKWKGSHPFPSGFVIIGLLLVNLLAAHALRFKVTGKGKSLWIGYGLVALGCANVAYSLYHPRWSALIQQDVMWMLGIWALPMAVLGVGCHLVFGSRKAGIVLVHAGLILMLLGEFITGIGATEGRMLIPEFGASNVIIDSREVELAFVSDLEDGRQQHAVIPEDMILSAHASEERIVDEALPLSVRIDTYMPNSVKHKAVFKNSDPTDLTWEVREAPTVTGTEQSEDRPSAVATLYSGNERVGQFVLSTWESIPPVRVDVDGRVWDVSLRFKQTHLPYTLQLNDFSHDLFTGTSTARNFSSDMRLEAADSAESRDAYIKMNHPLRYDSKAFFQAGFFQQPMSRNLGTILQVADNPGAWVPYLSCVVVTVGLSMHFMVSLLRYGRRARA